MADPRLATFEQDHAGRPGGGRRLPAEQRRSQLFEVALLLFAERGYSATTMDDIAEAAGVTKPLLYQHFDSKRALYLELCDVISRRIISQVADATSVAAGPRQQVELGFAAFFSMVADDEAAFRLLWGRDVPDDPEVGQALRRVEDAIAEAIDPLIDAGLEPDHRLTLAHAVVGMAEGACRRWIDSRQFHEVVGNGVLSDGLPLAARHAEAERMAVRLADLAWAGLRQVHRV
jgi:AcrR family transcriptional regulator